MQVAAPTQTPAPVYGKRDFWEDFKATVAEWSQQLALLVRGDRCTECVGWFLLTEAGVMRSGVSCARFKHRASACDFAAHRTKHCRRCLERAIQLYNDRPVGEATLSVSHRVASRKTGDPIGAPTSWVNPLSHDSDSSTCPLVAKSQQAPDPEHPVQQPEHPVQQHSDAKQPVQHSSDMTEIGSTGDGRAADPDDGRAEDEAADPGDELEMCGVCGGAGHSYKTCAR